MSGLASLLGLFGFLVSVAGSWKPSFWGDEAASVMSAERSIPGLLSLLGNVDAVHGAYYFVLHAWIDVFGSSELSTRALSALAVGVATAGTFVLARTLISTRVGVIAALVFAVLPRVTYMGAEARSAAVATAVAVWATVLLVHLLRSREKDAGTRFALWAGYAVLLAVGIYFFLYVLLLVPALGLAALLLAPKERGRMASLRAWALATVTGLALAAPVMLASVEQREQIAFIGRRPPIAVLTAAVYQWFGNTPLAVLAWGLVLLAVLLVFAGLVVRGRGRVAAPTVEPAIPATRAALAVMLAWMIVPSAALLVGTQLITPMYSLRYLSVCTPAVAIAIAVGIACLRPRWTQTVALVLIAALAMPSYLDQRGEFGKNYGADLRQAAEVVRAGALPGDAVVFDESVRPSRKPRLALHVYPEAFTGLNDITLDRSFDTTDGLWDVTLPLADVTDRLTGTDRVWVLQIEGSGENRRGDDIRSLQQLGFTVTSSTMLKRTLIIEMAR
ncbi:MULTISPECIES: glycosyltransferase family 39 protein [Cryobacterium]|uniref:Mannosyltransferase n=1 Tax=Cryobacterium breve TaxID=1259258 RepID=A0ABY2IXA5_9MICO|nr:MULTISPECIES: glycosyltransferase family 39 protein [Cryobacterium]TFC90557.1 mannosyltransferase [Cryobacterium sp. TmT3-12]TFC95649.1 mannosyltransferase [Cryobacterium breve]